MALPDIHFPDYPAVRPTGDSLSGRTVWRLYAAYVVDVPGFDAIRIPRGFTTDFASIPRLLHCWFAPSDPAIIPAAIAHDRLYRLSAGNTQKATRFHADALFRELMIAKGMGRIKAWLAWAAVRVFGFGAYQKN